MLLIQNAFVIDPKSGLEGKRDVLVKDGRILKIAEKIEEGAAARENQARGEQEAQEIIRKDGAGAQEVIKDEGVAAQETFRILDATGLYMGPGLVDVHVHFRDPGFAHKEDIFTGAKAAAAGGFSSVVLMANTKPTVDTIETLNYVIEKGKQTPIHIYTCANVTFGMQGKRLTPMEELAAAGAVGFTDDGIPLMDEAIVEEAMRRAKALNLPISFHEEDPAYIINPGVNRGKVSEELGLGGASRDAEIVLVARDLELALKTGVAIDIQHISSKEAVELVRQAKKKGCDVHAEATPHHFSLNEEAVLIYGTNAKMNPPLREEADRLAIIAGLQDGTIDMIATDHAPHAAEEKDKPFIQAPSGIIGLETALPLAITKLVEPGYLSLKEMLQVMSTNPADLYHLDAGYIAEGGPADLVLFDPKEKWIVKEFASKSANSPFLGWEMTGKVKMTICGGKIVEGA